MIDENDKRLAIHRQWMAELRHMDNLKTSEEKRQYIEQSGFIDRHLQVSRELEELREEDMDEEGKQRSRQLRAFSDLSQEERFALAGKLLERSDRSTDGYRALRKLYPDAPEVMLRTLVYHWYLDLPDQLLRLLAQIEVSLRDPQPWIHDVLIMEVIDYLYKVLQVMALLPHTKSTVIEDLKWLKEAINSDDDKAEAVDVIQGLIDAFEGSSCPPTIED